MTKFVQAKVARPAKIKMAIEKAVVKKKTVNVYKKSVSTSLVFRPLKFDADGYIGFKVTYSGKGKSVKRNQMTVILIPDVNFHKSYRPIAGALARATKSEVVVCAYNKASKAGAMNEQMIQSILDRVKQRKMRSALFVSENENILDLFRQKLNDSCLEKRRESFLDAESGSPILPKHVTISPKHHGEHKFAKKKSLKFVKISLQKDAPAGIVSRMVELVGKLFGASKENAVIHDEHQVGGVFSFHKSHYAVDSRWNMRNAAHCDLIAKDILVKVA